MRLRDKLIRSTCLPPYAVLLKGWADSKRRLLFLWWFNQPTSQPLSQSVMCRNNQCFLYKEKRRELNCIAFALMRLYIFRSYVNSRLVLMHVIAAIAINIIKLNVQLIATFGRSVWEIRECLWPFPLAMIILVGLLVLGWDKKTPELFNLTWLNYNIRVTESDPNQFTVWSHDGYSFSDWNICSLVIPIWAFRSKVFVRNNIRQITLL